MEICSRCVLDTTVPEIQFDENGVCQYCKIHDEMEKIYPLGAEGKIKLDRIVEKIKRKGRGGEHDCIVGVSGGRDSTYTLYLAKKLGLRPLAVHFDNGWNSEIAVRNIQRATTKLGVDLHTVVADWEEFKDLQISFLKASVPDAEVPTDWAIYSVLFKVASEENIKYVLQGHSFRTEGTSPIGWTYMDGKYINSVQKRFGTKKITSFPIMTMPHLVYYMFVMKIKEVRPLEYVKYNQKEINKILEKELGWEYYGGHHHESTYTHFFQSYILPKKFNIDKRKTEYSALVRSGQMGREDAISEIRDHLYPENPELIDYCTKKLGLSLEEFEAIMAKPPKSFGDYPTYHPLIQSTRILIRIACDFHLLPRILYLKYAL
ncbi:MAG: N-acetyl sugar amidotransferase [Candidatus Altiarchaeota archaeon]